MHGSTKSLCGWVGVCLLLFLAPASSATEHVYIETFETTTYKDVPSTTALWDVAAGELKLPPLQLSLVGSCTTPVAAHKVAVDGNYAYVADGGGLQVIDISDPTTPAIVGSLATPINFYALSIEGDYVMGTDYWPIGNNYVYLIDVSTPTSPVIVGTLTTGDHIGGRPAMTGHHAFVPHGANGLLVVDISVPSSLSQVTLYDTPGVVVDVQVAGDLAYVADDTGGLLVLDITDPANPATVGSVATVDRSAYVAVRGDYVFIADWGAGLQIADVSDPSNPVLIGGIDTPGFAASVDVAGDYAYVADRAEGVHAIDVSDPANPVLLDSYDTPGNAIGIAVDGEYVCVCDHGDFMIMKAAQLVAPQEVGQIAMPAPAHKVVVEGDYAYVAAQAALQVLDVSDPSSPTIVGSLSTPHNFYNLSASGDYVLGTDYWPVGNNYVYIIDVSTPTSPSILGTLTTGHHIGGRPVVAGNYAYVPHSFNGLLVMDLTDPTTPTQAALYDTPGTVVDVQVAGDYAYVADDTNGLVVLDITDPTSPSLAGGVATVDRASYLAVCGNYVFVADWEGGLQVVDISDPTNPTLAGGIDTAGWASAVKVQGDYAFVAERDLGVHVFDISDPVNPALLYTYDTPGSALGIEPVGDHLFVGDHGAVRVLQIYERQMDIGSKVGQSIAIDAYDDSILRARLGSTQTGNVGWELSADAGSNWQTVTPGAGWAVLTDVGSDLLWRSNHVYATGEGNPTASELQIEWLYSYAAVDDIVDVPDDQGGWIRIYFSRSGYDFPDVTQDPIATYFVFRLVDDPAAKAEILKQGRPSVSDLLVRPDLVALGDRIYWTEQASGKNSQVWEVVASVPARFEDTYVVLVPTVADLGSQFFRDSTYFLSAQTTTPGVYFDGSPHLGYSEDNIAPSVPKNFSTAYDAGGNQLAWDESSEADFQYFKVYRGASSDFVPGPETLAWTTIGTSWIDDEPDPWHHFYKLSAVDHVGNESGATLPTTVTSAGEATPRVAVTLHQNVPNPFNPSTSLAFELRAESPVTLQIYDVSGRLVRTLVDEIRTAGSHQVVWRGIDENRRPVASGTYVAQLRTQLGHRTIRMVLVR